ncbi:MAG: ATP-dependent 6-phosphofructokinase [Oligoflexia bacterium]|nr:ATP-dependent 6-phosphofructokinase [Oligoflexia bacterium]
MENQINLTYKQLEIDSLGEQFYDAPINITSTYDENWIKYESDNRRILFENVINVCDNVGLSSQIPLSFELAGQRKKLYFNPKETTFAIVTCGGLCPGINNVVRSAVMRAYYGYNAKKFYGIPFGYQGLVPEFGYSPKELTPKSVRYIHEQGGSVLGSSRGNQDVRKIVDTLIKLEVNSLITIGGDGTFRGANEIYEEIKRRGLKISVVGIPKTIDNDLLYIDKTFGFETAFSEAAEAITRAHVEATGAPNGVGLVKLMGRHSGFIAAYAALALREVNMVLIPEQKFKMESVMKFAEKRLANRGHMVIVVAEGAGQEYFKEERDENGKPKKDASGNAKLEDIGHLLEQEIKKYFKQKNIELNLKYIDPSYMIRSAPAYPTDAVFAGQLGSYAIDAAMAGKTGLTIGYWKGSFTHLPLKLATSGRNVISLESELWQSVLKATGQPFDLH